MSNETLQVLDPNSEFFQKPLQFALASYAVRH